MSMRRRDPSPYPESPDELKDGLRGRVTGITRIGPRAFGLAFVVGFGLIVLIVFGLNRGSAMSMNAQVQASNTAPPAPTAGESRFAVDEPLVVPTTAPTPAPIAAPPASSVPDLDVPRPLPATPAAEARTVSPQRAPDAGAARRDAALEARAQAELRRRDRMDAALNSPILAAGQTPAAAFAGNGGSVAPPAARDAGPANDSSTATAVQPANVALPPGASSKDFLQAQRFAPLSPYEIVASSVIPAVLITALDSDLPGAVTALVREDVYDSKTGHYVLIPKGSRLLGNYKSDVRYGQSRAYVAWTRLIFPDTTSIDLQDMSGADVEGSAGFAGKVDNHYDRVFGAALLTSVLAAGVQLAQPQNSSILAAPSASQALGQSVGTQIASTGTQILQKNLSIPPTLRLPRGYPFLVVVDRDIVLPGPYGTGE